MFLYTHYISSCDKNQIKTAGKNGSAALRAVFVCLAAAVLALILCGCEVSSLSSLRSFSRPYLGEYICEHAQFGDTDLLPKFREIVLSLKDGGEFTLTALPKRGRKVSVSGTYEYSEENGMLTMRARVSGKDRRKDLLLQDGKFVVEHSFAGKKLIMKFKIRGA